MTAQYKKKQSGFTLSFQNEPLVEEKEALIKDLQESIM